MLRYTSFALALLIAVAPAGAQQGASTPPPLVVKTFTLNHLGPRTAATLVSPYVTPSYGGGVFEAGETLRAITVRETAQALATIENLLRQHDRAPVSLILRFQLIAAESTHVRDPAIANVESALRGLFRFPGYRLLSEATTTATVGAHFHLLIPAGAERFRIEGEVRSVNLADGQQSASLHLQLVRPNPAVYEGREIQPSGLLGTGLTVPVGETVIVGSSAPGGKIQALILAVRPEVVPPRK